jgi:serine phosphatase RsbU (regulator of sigma subunit)
MAGQFSKFIWILITLSFCFHVSVGNNRPENNKIDSLLHAFPGQSDDSNKVNTLNLLCKTISDQCMVSSDKGDYRKMIAYASQAVGLAQKIKFKRGLAEGYWLLGYAQSYNTYYNDPVVNYGEGLKSYFMAERLLKELGNKKFLSQLYYWIADDYEYESNFNNAITYFIKSSDNAEESKVNMYRMDSKIRLGSVFVSIGDPEKAMPYFKSAFDLATTNKDTVFIIQSLDGIAGIQRIQKEFELSLKTNLRVLELSKKIKDSIKIAEVHYAIGQLFFDQEKYEDALAQFITAYNQFISTGDRRIIADGLYAIANVYLKERKYPEALSYYKRFFDLSTSIGLPEMVAEAEQGMSNTYEQTGNYKSALELNKKSNAINDSIKDFKKTREVAQNEIQYQFDKKEAIEKAEQDKKDTVAAQELQHQKFIRNASVAGFLLMLALAFFILRSYNEKKKANHIISQQKIEVELQKDITEEKNREIIASINYAKLIQSAVLPASADFHSRFPDSFVLFKPKAIVSGDFYWMQEINNFIYYATADCTGHGVPGGFMSMLGSSFLNEIILERNITEPSEILNMLRDKIIVALKQKGEIGENQDGMDIVICRIDRQFQTLTYAAANNPVWIIHDGQLSEYPCDKQPVGISIGEIKSFTQKSISLNQGDCIYSFSDGFADQFGGSEGKKFKSKPFKNLLISICTLPMSEQKTIINSTFDDWKGELEQIDDVCVIGIRV